MYLKNIPQIEIVHKKSINPIITLIGQIIGHFESIVGKSLKK